jgi:hypothetical protein
MKVVMRKIRLSAPKITTRTIRKLYCIALVSLVFCLYGCGTQANKLAISEYNPRTLQSNIEKKWGIQIQGIRLSAADYMLDFRYKIIDPNKAAPLLDRQTKPYLVDQQSGAKLIVPTPPKVGSLRQKSHEPISGKIYFVMFSNPGKLVKKGNKVTVVIGDFKTENLIVE